MTSSTRPARSAALALSGLLALVLCAPALARPPDAGKLFQDRVAPVLERRCLSCHNATDRKGGLSLVDAATALRGGESGAAIVPGDPAASYLLDLVTPTDGKADMPKDADPLSADEIAAIRQWIAAGAPWPANVKLEPARVRDTDWWSLRPLTRPALPVLSVDDQAWVRTPVDAFVLRKLREKGLSPSPQADRRTLIRRLYFDLTGLPPPYEEVAAFEQSQDPLAYERLVDRLLDSPQYGERWARHWLDVVHYGDTHGYDKDKPRPNAWPYRDYVIRALNADTPYGRFLEEQIAGDILYPDSPDGIVATGFIAAGPWDFISHVEVPEAKIDGQIARSLDRDDMVRTTMETFASITIGCARCHNHKFDPITQRDYYQLQAVFAAVDRADRPYDDDPNVTQLRHSLMVREQELRDARQRIDARTQELGGEQLKQLNADIKGLEERSTKEPRPEFGYHSQIVATPDQVKWVQVDLGQSTTMTRLVLVGCHDTFNNIGAGFGFPVRYKVEASDDASFVEGVVMLADFTMRDVPNPGVTPQAIEVDKVTARYVRVTATRLALRQNDYIFALAELSVFTPDGRNTARDAVVTSLDSIEAPVRWARKNLVDGYYYGVAADSELARQLDDRRAARRELLARVVPAELQSELEQTDAELAKIKERMQDLPAPRMVYAAATHFATQGNFQPTKGQPREIRLLRRGNILQPDEVVAPCAPAALATDELGFEMPTDADEGRRRAALARWLSNPQHPLTWRSAANRVWLYHFGRGIVDTPNDFGRMGMLPTHPELLDWLAVELRDNGQSLKHLHRLICNSATYRQSSADRAETAEIDASNQYLWRMNRRRLEAEAIRDAVLQVSGKLDLQMYGPGFQDFVVEKPEHSPHYQYHLYDPEDIRTHRRSVYRFTVRSQQQPFMTSLDCADPSMQVDKRNETVTPQQALALLNNKFMVAMTSHFGARVAGRATDTPGQIDEAFRLALSRQPTDLERAALAEYADQFGLENACRVILNLNEFVFVD